MITNMDLMTHTHLDQQEYHPVWLSVCRAACMPEETITAVASHINIIYRPLKPRLFVLCSEDGPYREKDTLITTQHAMIASCIMHNDYVVDNTMENGIYRRE